MHLSRLAARKARIQAARAAALARDRAGDMTERVRMLKRGSTR